MFELWQKLAWIKKGCYKRTLHHCTFKTPTFGWAFFIRALATVTLQPIKHLLYPRNRLWRFQGYIIGILKVQRCIIPCTYAIYKQKYDCSLVSFLSMTASIQYWIYPVPGIRKNIDLSVSKFTGIF